MAKKMRRYGVRLLAVVLLAAGAASAQVTIQGAVKAPDGSGWTGTMVITGPPQLVSGGLTIRNLTKTVTVTAGVFTAFTLYANTGSTPAGTSYSVEMVPLAGVRRREFWVVPASGPVEIKDIAVSSMPSPSSIVALSQLSTSGAADGYCPKYSSGAVTWQSCAGGGGGSWGSITGTLSSQTDLQSALDAKVPTSRTVSTAARLSGGGALSGNLTLDMASGVATPGTYQSLTVDTYGRVTAGAALVAADLPIAPQVIGCVPDCGADNSASAAFNASGRVAPMTIWARSTFDHVAVRVTTASGTCSGTCGLVIRVYDTTGASGACNAVVATSTVATSGGSPDINVTGFKRFSLAATATLEPGTYCVAFFTDSSVLRLSAPASANRWGDNAWYQATDSPVWGTCAAATGSGSGLTPPASITVSGSGGYAPTAMFSR